MNRKDNVGGSQVLAPSTPAKVDYHLNEAVNVAVVGSGPFGLATAFLLQQADYRVQLLEANERPRCA
jgi:monoamine oxidase